MRKLSDAQKAEMQKKIAEQRQAQSVSDTSIGMPKIGMPKRKENFLVRFFPYSTAIVFFFIAYVGSFLEDFFEEDIFWFIIAPILCLALIVILDVLQKKLL